MYHRIAEDIDLWVEYKNNLCYVIKFNAWFKKNLPIFDIQWEIVLYSPVQNVAPCLVPVTWVQFITLFLLDVSQPLKLLQVRCASNHVFSCSKYLTWDAWIKMNKQYFIDNVFIEYIFFSNM